MKYRVCANYIFAKVIAEKIEAESKEEAIEKALQDAEYDVTLCYQCANDFVDSGTIDDESCSAELID